MAPCAPEFIAQPQIKRAKSKPRKDPPTLSSQLVSHLAAIASPVESLSGFIDPNNDISIGNPSCTQSDRVTTDLEKQCTPTGLGATSGSVSRGTSVCAVGRYQNYLRTIRRFNRCTFPAALLLITIIWPTLLSWRQSIPRLGQFREYFASSENFLLLSVISTLLTLVPSTQAIGITTRLLKLVEPVALMHSCPSEFDPKLSNSVKVLMYFPIVQTCISAMLWAISIILFTFETVYRPGAIAVAVYGSLMVSCICGAQFVQCTGMSAQVTAVPLGLE